MVDALVGLLAFITGNDSPAQNEMTPCYVEDSHVECFWDASERGDGQGRDFYVDANGVAHFTYYV